jgi:hypothetical protein
MITNPMSDALPNTIMSEQAIRMNFTTPDKLASGKKCYLKCYANNNSDNFFKINERISNSAPKLSDQKRIIKKLDKVPGVCEEFKG